MFSCSIALCGAQGSRPREVTDTKPIKIVPSVQVHAAAKCLAVPSHYAELKARSVDYFRNPYDQFVGHLKFSLHVSNSLSVLHLYLNNINPRSIYQFIRQRRHTILCRNITPILVHTTVPLRWTFEVQPSRFSNSFSVLHLYFKKINPHSIYQFIHQRRHTILESFTTDVTFI